MKKITLLLPVVLVAVGLGLAYVDAAVAADGYDSPGVDETLPIMSRRKSPRVVGGSAWRPVPLKNSCTALLNRELDGPPIVPSMAMLRGRTEILQKRQNDYLKAHRITPKLRACVQAGHELIGERLFNELCRHKPLMATIECGVFSSEQELTDAEASCFFNLREAALYWKAGSETHFLLRLPLLERLALQQVDNDLFPVALPKNLEALDLMFFNLGKTKRYGMQFPNWSSTPATFMLASALPALKTLRLAHCTGLEYFFDRLPVGLEELQVVDCDELFATGQAAAVFWACVRASTIKKLRLLQHDYPVASIEPLVAAKIYNARGERIEIVWGI